MSHTTMNLPLLRALRGLHVPERDAEEAATVQAVDTAKLATRDDLAELRTATRDDIAELRTAIAGLRVEIAQSAQSQIKWTLGIVAGGAIAVVGSLGALLRFLLPH